MPLSESMITLSRFEFSGGADRLSSVLGLQVEWLEHSGWEMTAVQGVS